MAKTAKRTNEKLWQKLKAEDKAPHSALKMMRISKKYKAQGGGYVGGKSKDNSLTRWGKQKWEYSGGDTPGPGGKGVFLPKDKIARLKASAAGRKKLRRAAAIKAKADREGRQYSRHGLAAGTS